ncbi:MAG: helix-turn-helix domain-containing protein [Pseudomonadales bacterium]
MKLNGEFNAIDPFLDAVAHWQQDYIKLDETPFTAEFEQYVSSDFHIGRVRLSGHILQTGTPIPGAVSLALFDEDLPGTHIRDRELVGDHFGIADDGQQGALYFNNHADMLIFTVPVPAVHGFFGAPVDMASLRLSASARKAAFRSIISAMPTFPERPETDVKQQCIEAIYGAMTIDTSAGVANEEWAYHHDMVLQFVKGATDSTRGLSELIEELGLNRRRLSMHVSDTFGLTLVKFLKLIRINRARRHIHERGAEANVADIAFDAGLPHAGRFSQEFEGVFDELPNRAVERSKSRQKT